jgi:hypothetical protein
VLARRGAEDAGIDNEKGGREDVVWHAEGQRTQGLIMKKEEGKM